MFWILIFIVSCLVLVWSGSRLVRALMGLAKYLGWREFVVAFFVMAFAGSAPNLFVGINAALQGIPELSFAEIVGGNMVDLTIAVALAVLISGKPFQVRSKMVQTSALFTLGVAVLPLILALDNDLTRDDGLILLLTFLGYSFWLFSKGERFRKVYKANKNNQPARPITGFIDFLRGRWEKPHPFVRFQNFLKNLLMTALTLTLLLAASWGVVKSAQFFTGALNVSLPIIGILIVGLGNALPETYFAIASARKGQTWLILGDLMGSVIVCATLVLGIIVLIQPIKINNFSPFFIARIFLIAAVAFFFIAVRTDRKITRTEALFLLLIYISFLITEILFH